MIGSGRSFLFAPYHAPHGDSPARVNCWTPYEGAHLPPPKARGNGPRLCAEHQPQRHGEATRFGIIQRLCASALAAAGPSDTAAVRWWFQDEPAPIHGDNRTR